MTHAYALPTPPLPMRELVGPVDESAFDNPDGALIFPWVGPHAYRRVFDFGCGCGRIARQLLQQDPVPEHYTGIDLHKGMIRWCNRNLAVHHSGFRFLHHNAFNPIFNPEGDKSFIPLPTPPAVHTLVLALSVFTHLVQDQAEHYIAEVSRVLSDDGYFISSWFLFDKTFFPMMPDRLNALYIQYTDPTGAVIFDRTWLQGQAARNGLVITDITAPNVRGFQWTLTMRHASAGFSAADWPPDEAPLGRMVPPESHDPAPSTIGI